jgi:Protein of unknown function (DUF2628)
MKLYSVYAKPGEVRFENAVFVPQAFSWPAFVFGGFWALANRMWIVAAVMLAAWLALSLVPNGMNVFASLGIAMMAGIFAAELKEWSLRRRGYVDVGQAAGSDVEEAEVLFYANLTGAPPPVPEAFAKSTGADPLGLFEQA